jgi:hypothetical protein
MTPARGRVVATVSGGRSATSTVREFLSPGAGGGGGEVFRGFCGCYGGRKDVAGALRRGFCGFCGFCGQCQRVDFVGGGRWAARPPVDARRRQPADVAVRLKHREGGVEQPDLREPATREVGEQVAWCEPLRRGPPHPREDVSRVAYGRVRAHQVEHRERVWDEIPGDLHCSIHRVDVHRLTHPS